MERIEKPGQATLACFLDKAGNEFYIQSIGWVNEKFKQSALDGARAFCLLLDLSILGWDTFKFEDGQIMVGAVVARKIVVNTVDFTIWFKAGPIYEKVRQKEGR